MKYIYSVMLFLIASVAYANGNNEIEVNPNNQNSGSVHHNVFASPTVHFHPSITNNGGQRQDQSQGQSQYVEGDTNESSNSNSNENSNSTSVNQDGDSNSNRVGGGNQTVIMKQVRQAPTVMAPGLTSGSVTCLGSTSGGVSGPMGGITLGTTWESDACNRRLNATLLAQMGLPTAGVMLLCQDEDIYQAMKDAQTPCPVNEDFE